MGKTKKTAKSVKTKKAVKAVAKAAKKPKVSVVLRFLGTDSVFNATGDTILEALNGLNLPKIIKTKGMIYVEAEGKACKRILTLRQIRQAFIGNKINKMSLAKYLGMLLR